jgi:hypothetical protein
MLRHRTGYMAYLDCKPASPNLTELLRSTLRRLEQSERLSPDDPALREIKNAILRSIAELELARDQAPYAA